MAGSRWRRLDVVASTGSTHDDLVAAVRRGAASSGRVLVAEAQTAGRGRLGRGWTSPPFAGLTVSAVVAPVGVALERWSWLPLLTGVAVAEAVDAATGGAVRPTLKWPNDVLVGPAKLAGVLVERAGPAAVLSCGLNVTTQAAELPPQATSLLLVGPHVEREAVLVALLDRIDVWLGRWEAAGGDPATTGLASAYGERCATIGQHVLVELPGGERHAGVAAAVDADGRLVVGGTAFAAGTVVHVR